MRHARLWSRLYDVPLLLRREKAAVIEQVFRAHLLGEQDLRVSIEDADDLPPPRERSETYMAAGLKLRRGIDKPYALTEAGTALIPIVGTLVHRGSWLDSMSGLQSYDRIASHVEAALEDPEVKALMLEIDSNGGEAVGVMEIAARIEAGLQSKPVWAALNGEAYSAAYWLATAAERISAPSIGGAGSIGAVALHVDQSQRDAKQGYAYTFVTSGERKAEFSSHAPLSARAQGWLQAEVDRIGGLFVDQVARRRGLDAAQVRGTQAGVMNSDEALAGGYIDAIAPLTEAVAQLEAAAQRRSFLNPRGVAAESETEVAMAEAPKPAAGGGNPAATFTQQDLDNAAARATQEGRAAGVQAERERIAAILGCDEAKGRGRLALSLAVETDTDPAAAKKLLASAALESDPKASAFAAAMGGLKNPQVGADGGGDPALAQAPVRIDTMAIYESRRKAREEAGRR